MQVWAARANRRQGPTSNHALFRSLTNAIANCGHRGTLSYQQESERQHLPVPEGSRGRTVLPRHPSGMDHPGTHGKDDVYASPLTSIHRIKKFFDTVGQVLPYVNESALLRESDVVSSPRETNRRPSRSIEALLCIVFAHSLATTDPDAAEPFYHRALGLVLAGEQTVCISNLETGKCCGSYLRANANDLKCKHCSSWEASNRIAIEQWQV